MGRTIRAKRGVVTNMVGAELFRKQIIAYEFNGINMYATMGAAWRPMGRPFGIRAGCMPISYPATNAVLTQSSNGENFLRARNEDGGRFGYTNSTVNLINVPPIVLGNGYNVQATTDADGSTLAVTGSSTTAGPAITSINDGLITVGGGAGFNLFHGPMRRLTLTDGSSIQGTDANLSDGATKGTLNTPIPLSNATIEVDFIYKSGDQIVLQGNVIEILTVASGVLTAGINASNITLDGAAYAGELLVDGQHYRCTVDVDGGGLEVLGPLVAGGAMQNVRVTDAGDGWYFPLDEGAGADIVCWTANGSGRVPVHDGIWSGSDWQYIADNTRYYPMNEGSGDVFLCYDGDGNRVPGADATISNYSEDAWKVWPE